MRKATGASPITPKVIRRIVSKADSSNAPARRRAAIATSPSANESTSRATERLSGRPEPRLRAASSTMPARQSALNVSS